MAHAEPLDLTMKLRSFFYFLATVVSLLLLVGAGGFYWLTAQNPLSLLRSQTSNPSAAIFVARQAPLMASLLVNPDRLEAFSRVVANPGERRRARAELEQLKQTLLANSGLDYRRDVQPWLGREVTLALTTVDVDRDSSNGQQPGYLLALATQDPERSREFLQLFWQKRALSGTDLIFEQYKGVKLIYTEAAKAAELQSKGQKAAKSNKSNSQLSNLKIPTSLALTPTLASAVVGDRFVLFANHPKVLRDAINNVQAEDLNLTSSPLYQRTLKNLNQSRIGLAFVNLPQLATWLGDPTVLTPTATKEDKSTKPPQTYEGLAVSLGLVPQGLLAETALLGTSGQKNSATLPTLSAPVGALQYIPIVSPVSASGKDLNQLWSQVSNGLSGYETVAQLVNQSLNNLQNRWGIRLPDDVFSWVRGEYALGLLPGDPNKGEKTPSSSDWVFVAERSATDASKAIARLDDIARQQGLSVGPVKLADKTVSVWTRLSTAPVQSKNRNGTLTLQADIRGVHASMGKYEIFTTSVEAMDKALKATENSLISSDRFSQAIAPLLQPNSGYLYLDWATSQPVLERQLPLLRIAELAAKPLFTHLKSLTISSYGSQAGVQRSGVFLQLGR